MILIKLSYSFKSNTTEQPNENGLETKVLLTDFETLEIKRT